VLVTRNEPHRIGPFTEPTTPCLGCSMRSHDSLEMIKLTPMPLEGFLHANTRLNVLDDLFISPD
jgi:hypothetical protein